MSTEIMWAANMGNKKYKLDNFPFFAYGLSYGDVVTASLNDENVLYIERVVIKGGHSNYRILLAKEKSKTDFLCLWKEIEKLGVSYESTKPENIFAIDIPPSADVSAIYKILEEGELKGIWQFDEGNYEHSNKPKAGL